MTGIKARKPQLKENEEVSKSAERKTAWGHFLEYDSYYSEKLGVCASVDSSHGFLRPFMKLLEISCHGIPWFAVTIIGMLLAFKPQEIQLLMNLLIGLILDIVVVAISKLIIRRSRPAHNQKDMFVTISVDHFSFPSGHSTRAAMLLLIFQEKILAAYSPFYSCLVLGWALSVCASRVLLGRHHIFDVVCGFLIGLGQFQILSAIWLPADVCVTILEPYLGHFHL